MLEIYVGNMGDPSSFFPPRTNCDSFNIMLNNPWQNVISTRRASALPASCHAYPCLTYTMPASGAAACLPVPPALFVDCDSFNIMLNRGMSKKVMGLRLVVGRPIDLWQRMVGLWL